MNAQEYAEILMVEIQEVNRARVFDRLEEETRQALKNRSETLRLKLSQVEATMSN